MSEHLADQPIRPSRFVRLEMPPLTKEEQEAQEHRSAILARHVDRLIDEYVQRINDSLSSSQL